MTEELEVAGVGVDSTKIVTAVAGITALVTVVLNWLRGQSQDKEKAKAIMIEQYKTIVADMTKAAEATKLETAKATETAKNEWAKAIETARSEYAAYRAETTDRLADLQEKIAELRSQVHYFQLYMAQKGVAPPPKWDRRSDPSLCLDDDEALKESK